jgi:peptide methionine sulfoxide reductase MsrA
MCVPFGVGCVWGVSEIEAEQTSVKCLASGVQVLARHVVQHSCYEGTHSSTCRM